MFFALSLSACSTPYQDMGLLGGVRATQIDATTIRITARGNAFTDNDQISNYVLRKAAEETIAHNHSLFEVVQDKDQTRTEHYAYANGIHTVGYGPSGEIVGGESDVHVTEGSYTKPGEQILIRMFDGIKTSYSGSSVYDAAEVLSYLAPNDRGPASTRAVTEHAQANDTPTQVPKCTKQDLEAAQLATKQGYQYHLGCAQ